MASWRWSSSRCWRWGGVRLVSLSCGADCPALAHSLSGQQRAASRSVDRAGGVDVSDPGTKELEELCAVGTSARPASELRVRFSAVDVTGGQLQADLNVAPTKLVPAILEERGPVEPGEERGHVRRRLRLLRWGLLPN